MSRVVAKDDEWFECYLVVRGNKVTLKVNGEITVETIDNIRKQLVIPPGIQSGQKLRLAGQGMPALRDQKVGDAYAQVQITVPRDLSPRERTLLDELAQIRKDSIRK